MCRDFLSGPSLAAFCLGLPLQAGQQPIVLREYLNQKWTTQMVAFPFTAEAGACHPQSLRLTGPAGPVPVQLAAVEYWPDSPFVRSARLTFVTDLEPLATNRYTLLYGTEPAREAMPATDLRVVRAEKTVELLTSRFGLRLPMGHQRFDPPAAPADVPGPVAALRLADGTWFGSSRLYGQTRIVEYQARLTAQGPVFAEAAVRYTYENGNTLDLTLLLAAGDNTVMFDAAVKDDRPADGFQLVLNRNLPPLVFPVRMEFFTKRACFLQKKAAVGALEELALDQQPAGLVTQLTPWNDWWDDYTQTMIPLRLTGRSTELQIASHDAGAWVTPEAPGTMRDWTAWQHKLVPLVRAESGEVYLEVNLAAGRRRWGIGENARLVGRELDVVKDYVLAWDDPPGRRHPHLFLSREDLEAVWSRGPADPKALARYEHVVREPLRDVPSYKDTQALTTYLISGQREVALQYKLPERLRRHLGLLGRFDLMRSTVVVAGLYDALIDTDLVTPAERTLYRSQMAYLGYKLADPATWSIERGYRSYNPNMSVSYLLSLGIIACLIPDHPAARSWAQPAIHRMRQWLAEDCGPDGEWGEGSHYDHVTASMLVGFAIAAQRAGFYDFFAERPLKQLMLYIVKQYTPRDPQRGHWRVTAPLGRANSGERFGLSGIMARATVRSDPDYSRLMQWCWKEMGCSEQTCDDRLGGFEAVYLDPTLPAQPPRWSTELFPRVGVIMRHGVGTPLEHFVSFMTNPYIQFGRPTEPGSLLKVFSKGRPVGGAFAGGYEHRQELLMSRVLLARQRGEPAQFFNPFGYVADGGLTDFAALPRLDYAAADFHPRVGHDCSWWTAPVPKDLPPWPAVDRVGQPPLEWRRQVLFVKDEDPAGACYLVLNDTVRGGQPTLWQFWTLSEKIGTPDEVRDRERFLADKPGPKPLPPRPLQGDRFTAVGQFDLDVDYFIAAPTDTPRYTLRYGDTYTYPIGGLKEYQDLLQLRLAGDGRYYLVLFPRLPTEPMPQFRTLEAGQVIQVSGPFGTDHVLLSDREASVTIGDVRLHGTAASVQDRPGGLLIALGARGGFRQAGLTVEADGPVSFRRLPGGRLEVTLPAGHSGRYIDLTAPARYKWDQADLDCKSVRVGQRLAIVVPPGLTRFHLDEER